jgi:DNA-binding transcriptional regulator/RsmH inhibitor MraZ
MPRHPHRLEDAPYATWIVQVLDQNRVRIPIEIVGVVPWLKTDVPSLDCVGYPGPVGGIQVVPSGVDQGIRRQFTRKLEGAIPRADESNHRWVDAARLLATSWKIVLSLEPSRVTITLPEPVRRALELPGSGGSVVVFGLGEILELWDAVRWYEHVRRLANDRQTIIRSAVDDLDDR